MSATPGQLGRWTITGELGRGGMGVVYRAHDPLLGRDVALKRLTRATGEARARFQREARAAARLRHEHIVAVHELVELDGHDLLVMDLIEGEALDQTLERDGPLAPRRAVEVARDVARALEHAHAQGVLHRDVKPANVLVARATGKALLVDFGVARELDAARLTRTGVLVGTPAYLAPEQLAGDVARDARADVYSLGVTLHELLTGRTPFDGEGLVELMGAIQRRPAAPPSATRPEVDARLDALCLACLEKDPSRRYASAGALARDLERWLAGERVVGAGAARRGRRVATLLAGTLLVAALVGVATALSGAPSRRLDPDAVAARLAAAAPRGRPLAGAAGAVAALGSDLDLALDDAGEAPAWLRDARARVVAVGGLVALAEGDAPRARAATARVSAAASARGLEAQALAAALNAVGEEPSDDPAASARALSRAIDGGLDHPELRAWRAALLLSAPEVGSADAARAADDLERAAAGGRPDLATPSLRALALLRRGRTDEAAALEGVDRGVAAEVAAARARDHVERGQLEEALEVTRGVAWDGLTGRARDRARALADEAVRRAAPPAGWTDALVARGTRLLQLARRVDPDRAPPADLVRGMIEHATAYERIAVDIEPALDIADVAPDDLFVLRRVAGLEAMTRVPQRARLEAALRRGVALAPRDPGLLVPLADTLLDVGKLDEAGAVLDAIDALGLEGRDRVTPGVQRGRLLMGRGRDEEAAALLDDIDRQWGSHPSLREYRMIVHDRLDHGPLAVSLAFGVVRQEAFNSERNFTRERAVEVLWRRRAKVDDVSDVREALRGVLATSPELWGWQVRAALLAARAGDAAACAASLARARVHVGRFEGPERDDLARALARARPDDPADLERLVERLEALRGATFEP